MFVKVLGQLALFFLNELDFISQVMLAAQLVGFVRQVSHGVRQVLTESEKFDYFLFKQLNYHLQQD